MANNKPIGDNARVGAVRGRSQVFNPQNQTWTKRDAETGRFMDQKADADPVQRRPEGKEVTWPRQRKRCPRAAHSFRHD